MRCVIVVPTYNESATIRDLLEAIEAIASETPRKSIDVLVADDNNPDGTRSVVSEHLGFGDWVHIQPRASKDGLTAIYRAEFAAAVQDGYDVVVRMDADGSHPASAILSLLGLLDTNDVAIGSGYVPGDRTENWPARCRVLSWVANTWRCERHGLQLAEAPITFTERCTGTWKMSAGVAREAALFVLRSRVPEPTRGFATPHSWNLARHEGAGRA